MTIREKVRGMFLGVAIGDALGMPVETFSAERIDKEYGRITDYLVPDGHKWYDGRPAGTWTDDTQLTLAVAEGLIEAKELDLDIQAKYHVESFKKYGTKGWGNTTRSAVRELANGASWKTSAAIPEEGKGLGNGVCMKVAPFALLTYKYTQENAEEKYIEYLDKFADFCFMTHKSNLCFATALIQEATAFYCLQSNPEEFDLDHLKQGVASSLYLVNSYQPNDLEGMNELQKRMSLCGQLNTEEVIQQFGGGSCYCLDSLPFTHNFFYKNYQTIDSLYDVITAGGDADSNGSMLGALLGALHGPDIFPTNLVEKLDQEDIIQQTAERLCDALDFKE